MATQSRGSWGQAGTSAGRATQAHIQAGMRNVNMNNGVRVSQEWMDNYKNKNKNKAKKSALGGRRGGGSGALSKEAQALQDRQQSWLDSTGAYANSQGNVAGKMESRADRIGNRNIAAGEASSAVASSYDAALGQQNRNLRRYGMNPNSGRFAHGQRVMANARAAADAGARTKARRNADKDSMAAYGQTQNAYSQAANTGFGVYDRYDRLTNDFGADEAYGSGMRGDGSGSGGNQYGGNQLTGGRTYSMSGTIGGRKISRGGWSGNNNLRGDLTEAEKQANRDNANGNDGRFLGPNNQQTPLNQDSGGGSNYFQDLYNQDMMNNGNQFSSPYGAEQQYSFTPMPYDYREASNSGLDWSRV